jgi:outer membrane protein insertion porin family
MVGTTVGNIPFFEQFFVGGAETLRGYLEDRFWGNSMYLASIEYRRPIMKSIVGVLFVDVGDAFGSESIFRFRNRGLRTDFDQHGGIRPFASVGIGLRVATPIGPIRLDFGYGEEGGRTHFSIGHAF